MGSYIQKEPHKSRGEPVFRSPEHSESCIHFTWGSGWQSTGPCLGWSVLSILFLYSHLQSFLFDKSIAYHMEAEAPLRVIGFRWLALYNVILMMDNMRRRQRIMVNACPMCLANEESVDHLLLRCKVAQALWLFVVGWFDCFWTFPQSVGDFFQAWHLRSSSVREKIMWRTSFLLVLWIIWKEIDSRCFKGKGMPVEIMIERLKFFIAAQVFILLHFRGISIDTIMHGWREVAFSALMD